MLLMWLALSLEIHTKWTRFHQGCIRPVRVVAGKHVALSAICTHQWTRACHEPMCGSPYLHTEPARHRRRFRSWAWWPIAWPATILLHRGCSGTSVSHLRSPSWLSWASVASPEDRGLIPAGGHRALREAGFECEDEDGAASSSGRPSSDGAWPFARQRRSGSRLWPGGTCEHRQSHAAQDSAREGPGLA